MTERRRRFGWILLVPLVVIVLVLFVYSLLSGMPAVPMSYFRTVQTSTDAEAASLARGPQRTRRIRIETDTPSEQFTLWYPASLETDSSARAVVMVMNGTGLDADDTAALQEHLASWNFIVIGDDNPSAGSGNSAVWMMKKLEQLNADPDSIFFQKINLERIGIEGHGQGGAGALAAASTSSVADRIDAVAALSPVSRESAAASGWNYALTKIQAPVLLVAGTEGRLETETILPDTVLNWMYEQIRAPRAMARRTGADHEEMQYAADGLATAWLRWQLQDDNEAAKAFTGPDALSNNELYQDVRIDLEQTK